MCCNYDRAATTRLRKRIRALPEGKLRVWKKVTTLGYPILCPGRYPYGPGLVESDKQWRKYDPNYPHGLHFYLRRENAVTVYVNCLVVPVTIRVKDVIATDKSGKQVVALKGHIHPPTWKKTFGNLPKGRKWKV